MIFTSGSNGKPKCALLSAYNVLTASFESMRSQKLTDEDRTCLILPLFHIFGLVAGFFANLLAGSTLYFPTEIHTDDIIATIGRYRCTVFHAVPTMMLMLLNKESFEAEKLSSIRCTILSGAAATPLQIERFHKTLPYNASKYPFSFSIWLKRSGSDLHAALR